MTWGRSAQSQVRHESGTEGRSGLETLVSISPTLSIPTRPGPTSATWSLQGAEAGGAKRLSLSGGASFPPAGFRAQEPRPRAKEPVN